MSTLELRDIRWVMRWIKLIAILSLGLFFFGVLVVLHLCISVLRLPNRWKIVSRWIRGFTWSMIRILNIKITVEGDAGQLERVLNALPRRYARLAARLIGTPYKPKAAAAT